MPSPWVPLLVSAWLGCVDTGLHGGSRAPVDASVPRAPLLVSTWPADGSAGVPDELPRAWIALDTPGPLRVLKTGWRSPGGSVPHRAEQRPCDEVGIVADVCLRLEPLIRLPVGTHQIGLDEGTLDAEGDPVDPAFAEFDVTSLAVDPAQPSVQGCERDEERVSGFCLLRTDTSLRVRAFLSASAIVELATEGRTVRALASRAEVVLRLTGLAPDTFYPLTMRATGLDGATHQVETLVRTHDSLATLTISEVRADPLGPDPDQEYVEIVNYGDEPAELSGLRLADDPTREGDLVVSALRLPAGGRALLVPERFEPALTRGDVPIPEGVPLVRVDGPLATGGLTNSGEPLFLRDALGRRLSAVPSLPSTAGRCTQRTGIDPRDDTPASFHIRAACSPGRAGEDETW
ncbi:MAG: lamin tail domain-containing protein [Polyangiales bacterium]|nr:lamin tail domain-containing protein [Myxococcales bacterium]